MDLFERIMADEPIRREQFMEAVPGLSPAEHLKLRRTEMVKGMLKRGIAYTTDVVEDRILYLCPRNILANVAVCDLAKAESLEELWSIWVRWIRDDIDAAKVEVGPL